MLVSTIGSICSGHEDFPPRSVVTGSETVFIGDVPAVTVGDFWEVHCNEDSCHAGTSITGSSTVFVGDKPLCRVGDFIDCGSSIATTPNTTVFAE